MKRHTTPIALLDARENAETVIRIAQTLRRLTGQKRTRKNHSLETLDAVVVAVKRGNSSVARVCEATGFDSQKVRDVLKRLVQINGIRRVKRNCYKPTFEQVKPLVFWFTPYLDAPVKVKA